MWKSPSCLPMTLMWRRAGDGEGYLSSRRMGGACREGSWSSTSPSWGSSDREGSLFFFFSLENEGDMAMTGIVSVSSLSGVTGDTDEVDAGAGLGSGISSSSSE